MKHRFKNGKWMPENGTFVMVPNEQIPEVIQLLRDNGQPVWRRQGINPNDEGLIYDEDSEWVGSKSNYYQIKTELPFPDFKTLVTGKLPESWCIQCTEESVKHEAWGRFMQLSSCEVGLFYGYTNHEEGDLPYMTVFGKPFGEVLQIETWAALNLVEESTEKPCACKPVPVDIFPDEPLIRVLKSRGYTISKTY